MPGPRIALDRPEQCCGACLPILTGEIGAMLTHFDDYTTGSTELDKTTPAAAKPAALTALAALTPKARSLWWLVQKRPQYVVDIFLRWLHAPGQERVVRRRPGIANDINKQCTAACLTSHGSGHISAPPRWGAGSRRKPRRSLTTRTATSQAILAAEFYSRGRCALAAMPVHSLCADARQGWTRDGE